MKFPLLRFIGFVVCVVAICATAAFFSPANAREGFDQTGKFGVQLIQHSTASGVFVTNKDSGECISIICDMGSGPFIGIYDGKRKYPAMAIDKDGIQVAIGKELYRVSPDQLASIGTHSGTMKTANAEHKCPCGPDCQCENCECRSKKTATVNLNDNYYGSSGQPTTELLNAIDLSGKANLERLRQSQQSTPARSSGGNFRTYPIQCDIDG